MEKRRDEETKGRWDGGAENIRDGDLEKRRDGGKGDGGMERHTNEKTKGRRAAAAHERMDCETLQTMNRNTEGRRGEGLYERSDNER